jgi:hypothetical protein
MSIKESAMKQYRVVYACGIVGPPAPLWMTIDMLRRRNVPYATASPPVKVIPC